MIIKNESKVIVRSKPYSIIYKIIGIVSMLLLAVILLRPIGAINKKTIAHSDQMILAADAETVSGGFFQLNGFKVEGAAAQSSDFAFAGKYSMKLSANAVQYGFGLFVEDVNPGDYLRVQVWAFSPSGTEAILALSADKADDFYQQSTFFRKKEGNWGLLEIDVLITAKIPNNKLKIYCYTNAKEAVYFDNLSFKKYSKSDYHHDMELLKLYVKDGELAQLKSKRKEALEKGILMTSNDSWVRGAIYPRDEKSEKIKVELRLKGDWLDHLQGDKWSFRVSTEPEKAWNRLKVFSLQNPETRSFLKEWLLHEFFKKEDVLTTRYDFIRFNFNDKDLGIYVYEEHFTKQIPEYNLKREGPIVKFSESSLWESRLQAKALNIYDESVEDKISPDIQPFSENKTAKSASLSNQFNLAQNLLYEYQYKLKPASDIFDLDLLAKYYAIVDVFGAHHGIIWHNQRFYYNPISGKLEPIGFDGYDESGNSWLYPAFLGAQESSVNKEALDKQSYLFQDANFLKKYYFYLDKYSRENYLGDFLDTVRSELMPRYQAITSSFPSYRFSSDFLFERARKIRFEMLPTSEALHVRKSSETLFALCNRHNTALEIVGTANTEGGTVNKFDSSLMVMRSPRETLPDFSNFVKTPEKAKFIVYRIPGLEQLYYTALNAWKLPEAFTPIQELEAKLSDNHMVYFHDKDEKKVIFRKNTVLAEPIIIPAGYKVIFEAGTKMDIVKKGFIISYSPVFFQGTEEAPIFINSSDASANGFTVIKAAEKSELNYASFSEMNTLAYKGWNLTGAVTFYESDVDIHNCTFTKNHCEDALNIVRSNFKLIKSTISHTFADGFDADFCNGLVDKCYFYKSGNDGIDFSTSITTIQNTRIELSSDKGISIGEQGTATVINCIIDGAIIGIASKDLSKITVKSIVLKNCQQGFAAYQKKPEYGGGYFYVDAYEAEKVEVLYKILPGSYLRLIDKEIKGDHL
jgi:hypothetical protein